MTEQETLAELRRTACLTNAAEADLNQLVDFARRVALAANTIVFHEGDAANELFLIVRGSVALEICAPGIGCRRIATVDPGELLGWSPVLDNLYLTATARTIAPTEMIALPKADVLALCERSPRFGYVFMKGVAATLARRLSAARLQLLNVFGNESDREGSATVSQ